MAFITRFYNSKNGDRTYSAEDWADYFASFIGNGVFADPADGCMVMADSDMQVKVSPGRLWINGYYSKNTDEYPLTLAASDAKYARIDLVVARLDLTRRTTLLAVVKGKAAAAPAIPQLTRTDTIYELGLAVVTVKAGATAITQSDITDTRMAESSCGIVKGIIDQISSGKLFEQYGDIFHTWFDQLVTDLSGDVAGNLWLLIQSLNNSIQAINNQLVDDVTHKQYHLGISDGVPYIEEGAIASGGGYTVLSSDKNYIHSQTAASNVWTVDHNLGKFCAVTAVDSAGNIVVGNVEYTSKDSLTIKFSAPVSGKAYCN